MVASLGSVARRAIGNINGLIRSKSAREVLIKFTGKACKLGLGYGKLEIMKSGSHLRQKNSIQPLEKPHTAARNVSAWDTGNQDETGSFGGQASE